jgi:hypothetical protein
LKLDLDNLKKSQSIQKQEIAPDTKSRRIINIFKQSSMLHLWLITGILGYARKLPFLSKFISLLSLWYGKTTIWKILGKARKLFVILNALIGVYAVFKTVGFSFDNILIGFMAMGHTYFEVLGNLTNKLFNWFLNLFDHKIVPNVPNTKPGNPSKSVIDYITSPVEKIKGPVPKDAWNPILNGELPKISLRDIYMKGSPSIDITPWYRDTGTWMYIIGIGCSLGLFYLSYKIYSNPSWIYGIFTDSGSPTVTPGSPGPSNLPPLPNSPDIASRPISPDITLTNNISKGVGSIVTGIIKPFSYIKNKLNPFNYVLSSNEVNDQYQFFMDVQNNPATANRAYYPFTEVNPFLPWYKKLKVAVFGEGTFDALQRLKDKTYAERIYESIKISKGKYVDVSGLTPAPTPIAGVTTPGWASVGIGVKPTFVNYIDALHDLNVASKLNNITPIPKVIPAPISENILTDVGEWKNYKVDPTNIAEASDFVKEWKAGKISSSSNLKSDNIITTQNKFEVLEEILI